MLTYDIQLALLIFGVIRIMLMMVGFVILLARILIQQQLNSKNTKVWQFRGKIGTLRRNLVLNIHFRFQSG